MNFLAALINVPIPGAGQLLQRRMRRAVFFFAVTYGAWGLGWGLSGLFGSELFVIPALLVHLWCVTDALRYRPPA